MHKLLLSSIVVLSLAVGIPVANAGGGYGHSYHNGHGDYGDEILIGAGIIGGSILLGNLLAPRVYYPPAPAYYVPAPTTGYYVAPRAPNCVRDNVYRYLADGRIQWGVRTRCY
jgi:hypothetical protein